MYVMGKECLIFDIKFETEQKSVIALKQIKVKGFDVFKYYVFYAAMLMYCVMTSILDLLYQQQDKNIDIFMYVYFCIIYVINGIIDFSHTHIPSSSKYASLP
jgi:hypothetical protein